MKRAVVYYSLSGNTKEAAEYIAKELNADLFQIELVKPMPKTMGKQMLVGGMQSIFGMRPKVRGIPDNIGSYDEIILGTPVWAGKAASPVNSLIKKRETADKVTAVFTFSGGGDNDKCIAALSKSLKNMKHQAALADRTNKMAGENKKKLEKFAAEIRKDRGR